MTRQSQEWLVEATELIKRRLSGTALPGNGSRTARQLSRMADVVPVGARVVEEALVQRDEGATVQARNGQVNRIVGARQLQRAGQGQRIEVDLPRGFNANPQLKRRFQSG